MNYTKENLVLFVFFAAFFSSPEVMSQNATLESYVDEGLEHNISLQQKEKDYLQSLEKLKQAKSYFYPAASFHARYSRADGGRTFDVPVGDLLNPVYSTLNTLTQSNDFPTIENQEYAFLRSKEHETKVRVTQPLINGEIFYNKKINDQLVKLSMASRDDYKHQLVAEIKLSYFDYLKALSLQDILDYTTELLDENLRVAEKLYQNDKVTREHIYQAEAEIAKNEAAMAEARERVHTARAYFNFLLNRDLNEEIIVDTTFNDVSFFRDVDEQKQKAQANSFGIKAAEYARDAQAYNYKLKKSRYAPELSLVFDYGFQGENYTFDHQHDFYIASLVLEWPLFRGMYRKSAVQEAAIRHDKQKLIVRQMQQKTELDVTKAWYGVQMAKDQHIAAKKSFTALNSAFRVTERKYKEGMTTQIAFIDALNSRRRAMEQKVIANYNLYQKISELERVTAVADINEKNKNQ
jgi:outer membrane protein TolC